jgi:hypothetical protein
MASTTKLSVDKIIVTQEFLNFLSAARSFCTFLETKQSSAPSTFLTVIQSHLLSLYSCQNNLSLIELQKDTDIEAELLDMEMKSIMQFIGESLPCQYYWHVFDPSIENDIEPVCGDLVDDIGDIYKDIKRSLLLFDIGSKGAQETAIWQFKFYFDAHWGDHCVNALYAIHYFLQRDK